MSWSVSQGQGEVLSSKNVPIWAEKRFGPKKEATHAPGRGDVAAAVRESLLYFSIKDAMPYTYFSPVAATTATERITGGGGDVAAAAGSSVVEATT